MKLNSILQQIAKGIGVETGRQAILALSPVIIALVREIPLFQIESSFQVIPSRIWYYSVAVSICIIVILSHRLQIAQRKPRPIDEEFDFDTRLGFYRKKSTGKIFCSSCLLATPRLESPLQEEPHGWTCPFKSCAKFYQNPDYKETVPFAVQRPDPFARY